MYFKKPNQTSKSLCHSYARYDHLQTVDNFLLVEKILQKQKDKQKSTVICPLLFIILLLSLVHVKDV